MVWLNKTFNIIDGFFFLQKKFFEPRDKNKDLNISLDEFTPSEIKDLNKIILNDKDINIEDGISYQEGMLLAEKFQKREIFSRIEKKTCKRNS